MRLLIQRVQRCSVTIDSIVHSSIASGMLIFVGIEEQDNDEDIAWIAAKAAKMRIFDNENGVMNLSVEDTKGDVMIVSQFTLHASTRKGNRPSYIKSAKPDISIPIYEKFCNTMSTTIGKSVATGIFGADMKVELINDGPVTIFIDSKNRE